MADTTVREAVCVFQDETSLQAAADELMSSGFDRSHLSLLAGQKTVEERLGHKYEKVAEIEDDTAVPTLAYVGKDSRTEAEAAVISGLAYVGALGALGAIVATGGTIAVALAGAALAGGTGGAIGALLSRYIEEHHAQHLQEQLDHGGLLLWVRTPDPAREAKAQEILARHSAEDVHIHELPKATYTTEGGVSYVTSFMNRLGL